MARRIKEDPELRPRSVRLGVMSIVFSVFTFIFAVGGAWLFNFGMNFMQSDSVLIGIFLLVLGLGVLIIGSLNMLIQALLRMIAQFTVNKRAVGWIALVMFVAVIVLAIVFIAHF